MGYHAHHAIIVTSWDNKGIRLAWKKAISSFPRFRVSNVTRPAVNGYRSFFIAPDGSKEGWDMSNEDDDARSVFFDWMRRNCCGQNGKYCDWVSVKFGGDFMSAVIEDTKHESDRMEDDE